MTVAISIASLRCCSRAGIGSSFHWTAEGWLYVAAVDFFRVVGWSMNATMTPQFVADALIMAMPAKWRSVCTLSLLEERGLPAGVCSALANAIMTGNDLRLAADSNMELLDCNHGG